MLLLKLAFSETSLKFRIKVGRDKDDDEDDGTNYIAIATDSNYYLAAQTLMRGDTMDMDAARY